MIMIAVDPGNTRSAWVAFDGQRVLGHGIDLNLDLRNRLSRLNAPGAPIDPVELVVFEQIESFGMAVGREVFETVFETGRMYQAANATTARLTRKAVKLHLCQSMRAKDANIRAALIDKFGGSNDVAIGKKASPGPLFGIRADEWSALAIAVTWMETYTR
jgi:hypothetical protein